MCWTHSRARCVAVSAAGSAHVVWLNQYCELSSSLSVRVRACEIKVRVSLMLSGVVLSFLVKCGRSIQ
jgi:hypothetical protein